MLSGVDGKSAVGIASLAEGLTCALGVLIYILASKTGIDWRVAPFIILGAVCSVPFSAKSVKGLNPKLLKGLIAALSILLGIVTLLKTIKTF